MTLAADHATCAAVLSRSGSSFALPIRLLPHGKRQGTTALYAFCRRADDIVDDAPDRQAAAAELAGFEQNLRHALAGNHVDDPGAVVGGPPDAFRAFFGWILARTLGTFRTTPKSCLDQWSTP